MLERLRSVYQALKAFAARWRFVILPAATLGLIAGLVWSIRQLGLDWADVNYWPILIAFALTLPASILLNAMEFRLCGEAIDRSLDWRSSLRVTTAGTLANILPIPASLALRGKVLVDRGARLVDVGRILGLAAALWVAVAIFMTGVSLLNLTLVVMIGGAGMLATFIVMGLISRASSATIALEFLVVRFGMLALFALRLFLLFAALGVGVVIADATLLSGVGVVSATIAIVPSGIGLTEATGALLATIRETSPAAAFLVLGLNRVLSLAGNGLAFLATELVQGSASTTGEPA